MPNRSQLVNPRICGFDILFSMAESTRLPNSLNLPFVESMYADFLRDPQSVSADWRSYFASFQTGNGNTSALPTAPPKPPSIFNPHPDGNGIRSEQATDAFLQERVDQLIRDYRVRGHVSAQLDPLNRRRPAPPELDPAFYGF